MTITTPVFLTDYIPSAPENTAGIMLRMDAKFIAERRLRSFAMGCDEIEAAKRIITWYNESSKELDEIRRVGIVEYSATYNPPKVWATLLGLKDQGITDLPL